MRGVIRFSSAEAERQLLELRRAKERLDIQVPELQTIIQSFPADTVFLRNCRSALRKRLQETEKYIEKLLCLSKTLRDVEAYFEELERKLAAGLGGITKKSGSISSRSNTGTGSYWDMESRRSFIGEYVSRIWRRVRRYRSGYGNRYRLPTRNTIRFIRRSARFSSYRYGYDPSGLHRLRIKTYLMRRPPVYMRMRVFTPDWLRRLF